MESPKYQQLLGSGIFSAHCGSFSSNFILLRNPYWVRVLATNENENEALSHFISNSGVWQLRGTLQDGRTVQSNSLLLGAPTEPPYNVGFTVLKGVSFGEQREDFPLKSEFPLVNCYEGAFSMCHLDWELSLSGDLSVKQAQALSKDWRLPCEGMTLHCSSPRKKPEDHLNIARTFMTLASIALGTGVSSHRYILHWPSSALETWRFMTGDELGPGPVIPDYKLKDFIATALPEMESLSPERKASVRLAKSYINLSERPYLNTRLFAIMQVWEFLAAAWAEKPELSSDMLCLRLRIKKLLRDWRQDYPSSDPEGFWGNRLVSALDWDKLHQQVMNFGAMWGIDLEKLGVDLTLLRNVRNSVAHTGQLPNSSSLETGSHFYLFQNARYALRLALLRILGYGGPVFVSENGWRSIKGMDEALSGKYGAV